MADKTRADKARADRGRADETAPEDLAPEGKAPEDKAPEQTGEHVDAGSGSDDRDDVTAEGEVVGPDGAAAGGEAVAADAAVDEVADQVEVALDDVLATATSERDEFRDHLLRLQADFDNYRKRVHKELGEAGDRALGDFVDALLPVLDAVDAARAHGVAEVEQVAGLLIDLLAKQGLERVGADGDVFDPTLHDAVLHESGDDDVQTIDQVLRAGWRWRGKVLRPAMVKVVGG